MHNSGAECSHPIRALCIDIKRRFVLYKPLQDNMLQSRAIFLPFFSRRTRRYAVYRLLTVYEQARKCVYMLIYNHLPTQKREKTVSSRSSL